MTPGCSGPELPGPPATAAAGTGTCPKCGGTFEVTNNRLATHERKNRIAYAGSFRPITCTGSGEVLLYARQHTAYALALRILEEWPVVPVPKP